MAKERDETPRRAKDSSMSFRPGLVLRALIEEYDNCWGKVGPSETLRRLAVLAGYGFDARHHGRVVELQKRMAGAPDFAEACQTLVAMLRAVDTGRLQTGGSRLTPDERESEIIKIATEYELL